LSSVFVFVIITVVVVVVVFYVVVFLVDVKRKKNALASTALTALE